MKIALYLTFWTMAGLANAGSEVIGVRRFRPDIPAWEPFLWEMSSAYTIAALYPLVALAARRFPFTRQTAIRSFMIHWLLIIPFSLAHTGGMVAIRKLVYLAAGRSYDYSGAEPLSRSILFEFYQDIPLYWIFLMIILGIGFYRDSMKQSLHSEQLQRQLAQAQLQNLRGQLNPHFLFNTLNMISAKMYEDPGEADRMIARLSDLLRITLDTSNEIEVDLRTELATLELYLEIMKARFQDLVRVRIDVEPQAQNARVPGLLLLPLVENAFKHGVGKRVGSGEIEISGRIENEKLVVVVRDNGPGLDRSVEAVMPRGIGLSNTAARLRQLYGADHVLDIRNASGGGLNVRIDIPIRAGRASHA